MGDPEEVYRYFYAHDSRYRNLIALIIDDPMLGFEHIPGSALSFNEVLEVGEVAFRRRTQFPPDKLPPYGTLT